MIDKDNIAELRRLEAEQIQETVSRHLCKLMDDEWGLGHKLYMDTAKEILDDIALPELLKALEWQPISTAPKDGTKILLRLSNGEVFSGWGTENGVFYRFHATSPDVGWLNAKEWMPLPPHGGGDVG